MSAMLPPARPRISSADLEALIAPYGIDRGLHPLLVVGQRAYYNQMGGPGNNRGIYDDAISLITPNVTATYNGNVDPSAANRTGLASLKPGLYHSYRFDRHKGEYMAICQRAGEVIVKRDNTAHMKLGAHPDYGYHLGEGCWRGWFGINIHRGGVNTTSSLGCQTIPPEQWEGFIALATGEAKRLFGDEWKARTIPYLLIG